MALTKKHYIRAAEICREVYGGDPKVTQAFVDLFLDDNPRFDTDRFRAACETGRIFQSREHYERRR
jgi:ABC-type sulfate transport system substrate-binding protein